MGSGAGNLIDTNKGMIGRMNEELEKISRTHPIVLFDGRCGLCDRSVRFLIARDKARRLRYLPLQDPRSGITGEFETIIVLSMGEVFERSRAIIEIGSHVDGLKYLTGLLRLIPNGIRDCVYRFIAKRRFRIWGRLPVCRIPAPDETALFL